MNESGKVIAVEFPQGSLPPSATNAVAQAAAQAAAAPELLPSFPAVVVAIDNYAKRVPWWVVVGVSVGATYWYMTRKKGG